VTAADDSFPQALSFAYSEEEYWTMRKLEARRFGRGPSFDSFWFVIVLFVFGVGLAVLAAFYAGLVEAREIRAVLATAYIGFTLGAYAMNFLMHLRSRQVIRQTFLRSGRGQETWRIAFGTAGIDCKTAAIETHVDWTAVTAIEDWGPLLGIWLSRLQVLHIPARVFADDAARKVFIAAVRARIDRAAGKLHPTPHEGTPE